MPTPNVPPIYREDIEFFKLTGRTSQAIPAFFRSEQVAGMLSRFKPGGAGGLTAAEQQTTGLAPWVPYLAQIDSWLSQMIQQGVPRTYVETIFRRGLYLANLAPESYSQWRTHLGTYDFRTSWTGAPPALAPDPGYADPAIFPPYRQTAVSPSPNPAAILWIDGTKGVRHDSGSPPTGWTNVPQGLPAQFDYRTPGTDSAYRVTFYPADWFLNSSTGTALAPTGGSGQPPVIAVDTATNGGIGIGGLLPPAPTQTAIPAPPSIVAPIGGGTVPPQFTAGPSVELPIPRTGAQLERVAALQSASPDAQGLPGVTILASRDSIPWLWLAVAAAGLYFLSRK
jgi:hypothetical protein